MTPDDRDGSDDPTKPLPVESDGPIEPGATEPLVAPHVPLADVSTAELGHIDPVSGAARPDRSRALTAGLIAAVALLGTTVIVFLTLYFQNDQPAPTLTPVPSSSPTVTTAPEEEPPVDVPETPEDDEPEPTTPPEPTEPPDPGPTETAVPAAL